MGSFRAVVIEKGEGGQRAALATFDEADLMEGDVTVRVTHSTLNYKDGLALTGQAPVVRRFPMIPGIDFAGIVEASDHPDWKPGDAVVLNGWGLGETHLGSYAEKARVKGEWLVPLPASLTPHQAMAIGTAGYTAMLSVLALERHGLARRPARRSSRVQPAASARWRWRSSPAPAGTSSRSRGARGRPGTCAASARPRSCRATNWPSPRSRSPRSAGRPASTRSRATTLANVLSMTRYGGAVAACGLAAGMDLPTSSRRSSCAASRSTESTA